MQRRNTDSRKIIAGTGRALSVLFACLLVWLLAVDCLLSYTGLFHLTGDRNEHILFLLVVSTVLTLSMYLPMGKWLYLIQTFALLFPVLLLQDRLLGGFCSVANEVLDHVNRYYGTAIPDLTVRGLPAGNGESHIFFLYLMTLMVWLMAYGLVRRRRAVLPLLPPVLYLVLLLAVGKAPVPEALLLFFLAAAGTLCFAGGVKAEHAYEHGHPASLLRLRHTLLGVCLCGLVVAVMWRTAYPKAQSMVEHRHEIEDFAGDSLDYVMQSLSAMQGGFSWFGWNDQGRITNGTPRFQETEVLRVTADRLPQDTVYLRGYVGDTYDHGKWSNEGSAAFREETEGWDRSLQDAPESQVQSMVYDSQQNLLYNDRMDYRIEYTGVSRPYAYLPYFTSTAEAIDADTGDAAALEYVGDSIVKRDGQHAILVTGYQKNSVMYTMSGVNSRVEQEFMDRYGSYAQRYTAVDEDLTDLKALGDSLMGVYRSQYAPYVAGSYGDGYSGGTYGTGEQMRQLICIYLVQQELWKRSYELELDRVPFGEDVVEYFLFQGEKGYCEHFASAGVLLLREMGVPARYVSGYVVWKDDFSAGKDGYTASVPDSKAHAWAEVYLDGVGWIPVEMTPGSSSGMGELTVQETGDILTIQAGSGDDTASYYLDGQEEKEGEENGTDPELHQQQTGQPEDSSEEEREDDDAEDTEEAAAGQSGGNDTETGQPSDARTVQRVLAGILCAAVLVLAGAGIFLTCRSRAGRPEKGAKPGSYGYSVQLLSCQIYRLLRRQGLVKGRIGSDEEFRRQLMEQRAIGQEDVVKYLHIIEKAAYSRQEITAEEAESCRRLCRRLKRMKGTSRSPVRRRTRRRSPH